MALQVIGTGQARTGTTSLKAALEHLGFGKCYHMIELMNHPDHLIYFEKAQRGEDVNWDELLKGYHSACDMPIIAYYKQVIKKYKDVKVIHTTRDPEAWYKSMTDTIFWAVNPSPGRILRMMIRLPFSSTLRKRLKILKFNGKMVTEFFGNDLKDKTKVISHFNEYEKEVFNTIPKTNMLLYDVKSGWEPLCKFLNVPVPSIPFPKSNTKDEFVHNVKHNIGKKELY